MSKRLETRRDDSIHRASAAGRNEEQARKRARRPENLGEDEMEEVLRNLEELTGFEPPLRKIRISEAKQNNTKKDC